MSRQVIFRDDKSKAVGRRWYCFACFHESTAEEAAYVHGASHGTSTMTFLSYKDHSPVGSGTFTYLTGMKCAICNYTGKLFYTMVRGLCKTFGLCFCAAK